MRALIVIDIQNDYYPKGAIESVGILDAHKVINIDAKKFRDRVCYIYPTYSK